MACHLINSLTNESLKKNLKKTFYFIIEKLFTKKIKLPIVLVISKNNGIKVVQIIHIQLKCYVLILNHS